MAFALADGEGRPHGRVVDVDRGVGPHGDLVRPPEGACPALDGAKQRLYETVLGPRGELHDHLDFAGDTLDHPQRLVRDVDPELVAALALLESQRISESHDPGVGRERRLEHQGAGHVAALARKRRGGTDRPMTRVRVEQPGEHGVAVVAGQAQASRSIRRGPPAPPSCSRRACRMRRSAGNPDDPARSWTRPAALKSCSCEFLHAEAVPDTGWTQQRPATPAIRYSRQPGRGT